MPLTPEEQAAMQPTAQSALAGHPWLSGLAKVGDFVNNYTPQRYVNQAANAVIPSAPPPGLPAEPGSPTPAPDFKNAPPAPPGLLGDKVTRPQPNFVEQRPEERRAAVHQQAQAQGPRGPAGPDVDAQLRAQQEGLDKGFYENVGNRAQTVANQRAIEQKGQEAADAAADRIDAEKQRQDVESKADLDALMAGHATRNALIMKDIEAVQNMHVDERKWFKDRGVGGSILAAIAMGAGAFGANMPHSGGQNAAQHIIDTAVEREIDSQKSDIANKWQAVNFKADQETKDFAAAQFARREKNDIAMQTYSHAMKMVEIRKANTQDKVRIAGYDNMLSDLQDKVLGRQQDNLNIAVQARERDKQAARAAAAAEVAERRKREEAERKDRVDFAKSGNFVQSEESKAAGVSPDAALAQHVHMLHTGDSDFAGHGQMVNPRAADKGKEDDAKAAAALDNLKKTGEMAAKGATAGAAATSVLPRSLAPESNRAMDAMHDYNSQLETTAMGAGMKPGAAKEFAERHKLTASGSKEGALRNAALVAQANRELVNFKNIKGSKGGAGEASEPEGKE